ncbi:ssDNA-binding protein [Mesorhizobium sp.]|uniref:ssDNA-binding protein n=1 Tax=Mesorhizobium sp. TaxID=1871066 RepID=UPI000FEA6C7A|nr:ssDNA-binding protein [Mesorhizobium sp.]RWP29496.1 MAG: DUF2815 family protein [Mesorhizobium sp.]RWP69510.1 MAG: DUF2815 family protein [Mesorhizobium sp.]
MGKVNEKDKTGRTVTLTNLRASFAESLKEASLPRKNKDPNAKPKHGANFILVKGEPDFDSNKAACISAMKAAGREFKRPEDWWKTLWDDKPDNLSFKKGDRFKTDAGEIYKGYEGNLVVSAKGPRGGLTRPQIRDRNKRIIEVSEILDVVYNGTYCDAVISFYGTENGGTPRITCSVEAIRSRQTGDRLGGGGIYVDDDDFDTLEADDSFDSGPSTEAKKSAAKDDFDF